MDESVQWSEMKSLGKKKLFRSWPAQLACQLKYLIYPVVYLGFETEIRTGTDVN